MHLLNKFESALRATINLCNAGEIGRAQFQIPEPAGTNRLPLKFVERILQG